jgi:hypothetical protein
METEASLHTSGSSSPLGRITFRNESFHQSADLALFVKPKMGSLFKWSYWATIKHLTSFHDAFRNR